jgi:hypothetical protein
MPAIVSFDRSVFRWPLQIKLKRSLRHDDLPFIARDEACAGAHWLSAFDMAPGGNPELTEPGKSWRQSCEETLAAQNANAPT